MDTKRASDGVGSMLREARIRRDISLRRIAESTKISVRYLEALERNDISRLPGGLFSRSFVRSYAIEVGLDSERIVAAFLDQFPHDLVGAGHPTTTCNEGEDSRGIERRQLNAVRWVAVLGGLTIVGMLYLGFAVSGSSAPGQAVMAQTESPLLPSAVQESIATVPQLAIASAGRLASRKQPGGSHSRGALASAIAGEAVEREPVHEGTVARLTVALRATAPCWVTAIVDGSRAFDREFVAGEQHEVTVHTELLLTVGDASALRVFVNGVDAGPLGGVGQLVTTSVTPDNFRDLLPTQ